MNKTRFVNIKGEFEHATQAIVMDGEAAQTALVVEIRAKHDRNRLLGTYDPERRILRLFHRGETITLDMAKLLGPRPEPAPETQVD